MKHTQISRQALLRLIRKNPLFSRRGEKIGGRGEAVSFRFEAYDLPLGEQAPCVVTYRVTRRSALARENVRLGRGYIDLRFEMSGAGKLRKPELSLMLEELSVEHFSRPPGLLSKETLPEEEARSFGPGRILDERQRQSEDIAYERILFYEAYRRLLEAIEGAVVQ